MKKVISLLLVCLMMFSTVAIVSAADITVSVSSLDKSTAEIKATTNLDIYVNISAFPADNVGLVDLVVNFDPNELIFNAVRVGEIVTAPTETVEDGWLEDNYEGDIEGAIDGEGFAALAATGWVTNKDNANNITHADAGVLRIATNMPGYAYSNLYKNGKDKLVCLRFRKNMDGIGGSQEVSVAAINFASTESDGSFDLNSAATVTYEAGTILLPGGEPEPDPEPVVPEKSTVKTFPKLKWDAETGSLTTVGVVTIGKDIEGMKYGINIVKGEGTVNYWTDKTVLTTSGAEAYYAIQLDGIKDTTDITVNSASKAVLSNGATGEAVTYVAE